MISETVKYVSVHSFTQYRQNCGVQVLWSTSDKNPYLNNGGECIIQRIESN